MSDYYTVKAGTPFVSKPKTASPTDATQPVAASAITDTAHTNFAGVTVKQDEPIHKVHGAIINLQRTGRALIRVMGPAAVGDMLNLNNGDGTNPGTDYLSTGGNGATVGRCLANITDTSIKLIEVDIGAGGGGGGMQHRGEWSEVTTYSVQNIVTRGYLGEFICFQAPPGSGFAYAPEIGAPYWHAWGYPAPGQWA